MKVIYVILKVFFIGDMTVHFGHWKYSQWDSKSAPKNSQSFIISIGQTICKENIIEVNLEQIIPPWEGFSSNLLPFRAVFSVDLDGFKHDIQRFQ